MMEQNPANVQKVAVNFAFVVRKALEILTSEDREFPCSSSLYSR